jgi:hypothetical protein
VRGGTVCIAVVEGQSWNVGTVGVEGDIGADVPLESRGKGRAGSREEGKNREENLRMHFEEVFGTMMEGLTEEGEPMFRISDMNLWGYHMYVNEEST